TRRVIAVRGGAEDPGGASLVPTLLPARAPSGALSMSLRDGSRGGSISRRRRSGPNPLGRATGRHMSPHISLAMVATIVATMLGCRTVPTAGALRAPERG